MRIDFNELTEAEAERLAILIEECGEVQQIAGKILRHGYSSFNPRDEDKTSNQQLLEKELGDLGHAVNFLINNGDVNGMIISKHSNDRKESILEYLHHHHKYQKINYE